MTASESHEMRARMVAAARACLGTPWHHQARLPGVGMDCVGLIRESMIAAGAQVNDNANYGRRSDIAQMLESIREHGLVSVQRQDIMLADFLLFRMQGRPQHAGIVSTEDASMFIHIPATGIAKCVETRLDGYWTHMIYGAWRLPSLAVPL